MDTWNAKYRNKQNEFEVKFCSDDYEKAKAVERVCQYIMDGEITSRSDVAQVRRGEWLDLHGDYQTAKCSFCASQYEVTFGEESNGMLFDGFKRFYKYCPHCGAKMEVGNG